MLSEQLFKALDSTRPLKVWHWDFGSRSFGSVGFATGASLDQACSDTSHRRLIALESRELCVVGQHLELKPFPSSFPAED